VGMPYIYTYDHELERKMVEEGEKLGAVGRTIVEIAKKVAEQWYGPYTTVIAYVSVNEGIADYIYVGDRMFRAPWKVVFPVLLKHYGEVVIDNVKLVRKDKVVGEIRKEVEMLKQEIAKLAKRKSKSANEVRELLEKDLNLLSQALDYLTRP
jgi:hypothetical protein